jgi:FtsP/CotA-like multicopper oxidase with cupredoxin domain
MTYRTFIKRLGTLVLMPICLTLFLAGIAFGVDYYLKAGVRVIPAGTFNNDAPITMWGYAKCSAGFANCTTATVPGPTLTVASNDSLNIHVFNNISGSYKEPTSVVISGLRLPTPAGPVWIDPADPTGPAAATGSRPAPVTANDQNDPAFNLRVRSFVGETAFGQSVTYTWPAGSLRQGTFLYESGTHPAVQVQMGLYGPLVVYPPPAHAFGAAGTAYGTAYNTEALLLFSEIDPVLHDAIATGDYGPGKTVTSTFKYVPKYFLINGQPYSATSTAIPAGAINQTVLLRFLNASLNSKTPTLQDTYNIVSNGYMTELAEDGYPYSHQKRQYSQLLPAGKTMDAVITTTSPGANIAIYDKMLGLSNGPLFPGGALTYLNVGNVPAVNVQPTSVNFGTVQLYNPMQQIVWIKNNGLQPLIVSNTVVTGTNAAMFQTNWNGLIKTIAPGASDYITVYFTPTAAGPTSATLQVISNDPNQDAVNGIQIPLSGTGI